MTQHFQVKNYALTCVYIILVLKIAGCYDKIQFLAIENSVLLPNAITILQ